MREIRTSGSTGRGWKRTYGSRTWHRRESKAEEIHTVPLRAPRHLLTLPWAAEETDHPREVIEAALAHVVQNRVEAAEVDRFVSDWGN